MKSRVAAWSFSDIQQGTWRIHSTLILPEDHDVATLDNKAGTLATAQPDAFYIMFLGLLAVGCGKELSIYTLVLENDLPTWSKKWTARSDPRNQCP